MQSPELYSERVIAGDSLEGMDLFFYCFYLRMKFKADKNIYKNGNYYAKKETT